MKAEIWWVEFNPHNKEQVTEVEELLPRMLNNLKYDYATHRKNTSKWSESEYHCIRIIRDGIDPDRTYAIFGDKPGWSDCCSDSEFIKQFI